MILRYDNDCTTARLEGRVPVHALEAVERTLTYTEPGARFSPAYRMGHWDGKRCLFNSKTQSFPAGLGDRIEAALEELVIAYTVEDERKRVDYPSEAIDEVKLNGINLYDAQRAALHDFFSSGAQGCLALPTNFGKTECAAAVLKIVNKSALVLMDSKSLMAQTAERLEKRLGVEVGVFGGGRRNVHAKIIVATIQSIWHHFAKLKKSFLKEFGVLVVDECHKISPKMWFKVLAEIPAPVRLGLSATIKEASRRLVVESYLGPIVHEASVASMIEAGRAAAPTITMVRTGGIVRAQDPQAIYEEGIVYNITRNNIVAEAISRCMYDGETSLVLVVRIDHGQILKDKLEARGIYVPFLHGGTPLEDIVDAKKKFGTSSVPAIIASTIFDLGQDMPEVRVLILAGGQRSPLRTIQRVGRSLRVKKTGPNTVRVIDFFDMACRMLRNQSDERRRTYKRKYGNVVIVDSLDQVLHNPARPHRTPVL